MKTAGNILSTLFDEQFLAKAQGYSKLHNSWSEITAKNEIAAAASHSRIKGLEKGILLIETDHPGWKQILQTKQSQLLNDYRRIFPEFGISGISLMLGCSTPHSEPEVTDNILKENSPDKIETEIVQPIKGYDAIKDDDFREKLIKLGKTIAAGETGKK